MTSQMLSHTTHFVSSSRLAQLRTPPPSTSTVTPSSPITCTEPATGSPTTSFSTSIGFGCSLRPSTDTRGALLVPDDRRALLGTSSRLVVLPPAIQKVMCLPSLPLTATSPRFVSCIVGSCSLIKLAVSSVTCALPADDVDSILLQRFTVSPNMVHFGLRLPTTFATKGPELSPMRIFTEPMLGSDSEIKTLLETARASAAKRAMMAAWSFDWSWTRLVTPMYASPMVSSFQTPCSSQR
mmetsp:Transcript_37607/g.94262  ORF Transcript_37607/g.94262 Transcript_37607/m.94262 type:complete len:239 (-) Transcript_37607:2276-2992(-)